MRNLYYFDPTTGPKKSGKTRSNKRTTAAFTAEDRYSGRV